MVRPLRALGLLVTSLLGACVGGAPATDCDRFCDGFLGCLTDEGRCTPSDSAALRAFCTRECTDLAATLTATDRARTVGCLDCLEGDIARGMCTNTLLGESLGADCSAACTGVPFDFAMRFGEALNAESPPLYTCTP